MGGSLVYSFRDTLEETQPVPLDDEFVFLIKDACQEAYVTSFGGRLGFVAFDWMTKGQQLSIPMILGGATILYLAYNKNTFAKLSASN